MLGFETCRQLAKQGINVILSLVASQQREKAAAEKFWAEGLDVSYYRLMFTNADTVQLSCSIYQNEWDNRYFWINNAGVLLDSSG